LRAPRPRPTALARMLFDLSRGREHDHPVLDAPGWWRRLERLQYAPVTRRPHSPAKCMRENATGPLTLTRACAQSGIKLVTFSSDLVFDGKKQTPYVETDETSPLNVYGQSKAAAEREVLSGLPDALVVRTSAFFGPWDEYNFVTMALRTLASGQRFRAANDAFISPTYVPDLVHATLDLLIDNERGVWHLANAGVLTWADFARSAAGAAGLDSSLVEECSTQSLNLAARRPRYSVLTSERGSLLPSLNDALTRYLGACEVRWMDDTRDEQSEMAPRARAASNTKLH
jgi:dTDP-4-dehydrorhamnose reductase